MSDKLSHTRLCLTAFVLAKIPKWATAPMWRMSQEGRRWCLAWLRFPVWSARYINFSLREFASVKSFLLFSDTYWLLVIFRHESPERLCGPGAAGGDVGPDQCAAASMRLSRGRGGRSGGSELPQQPACSRLQVHTEQDRGHQGHGYGASVGPFLVRRVAYWNDAK